MHERTSIQLSAADRRLPLSIQKRMRANELRRDRIAQVVKVTARNSSRKRATGGSPCFCQTRASLPVWPPATKGAKAMGIANEAKTQIERIDVPSESTSRPANAETTRNNAFHS